MKLPSKQSVISTVLWLALLLAMAASVQHLAWTFGTVERAGFEWRGWVPALALDGGLAALAYTIQQRRRVSRKTWGLWAGVVGFAAVSALANFYHALHVEGLAMDLLWVKVAKALILSATLPVAYIFLGEIVSGDDAQAAETAAKRAEREQKRSDQAAERALLAEQNEAARLALEVERATAAAALPPVLATPSEVRRECSEEGCGYVAIGSDERSAQNRLNAHKSKHNHRVTAL